MKRRTRVGREPLLALALLALGCSQDVDGRPNLLLISLDSVRADFIGAYGANLPHAPGRSPTPNIDRLAAEGVLYENARSTTSWTLPAHASLFTGRPELIHGVEQDGMKIPEGLSTIAQRLDHAGYRTFGVYSGPYLDPRYGFGRGFDRYESGYGPELALAAEELSLAERLVESLDSAEAPERSMEAMRRRRSAERVLEAASHRDVSSVRVTELALAELASAADGKRPFFLFAHYFDAHYDYTPPEPFARAFDPDYSGALDARSYFGNPSISAFDENSPTGRRRVVSQRDLEHIQALYAGEIAWVDSHVGRLLAALDRLGLAENTLVVVVGDHGDEFFEHGSIGHRQTIEEEVLRVPVVLRKPVPTLQGERRSEPIALFQLADEIFEALGAHDGMLVQNDGVFQAVPPIARQLSPIARLVRPESIQLEFPWKEETLRIPAVRVRILEGFRDGPIQLYRERSSLRPSTLLEADQLSAFERAAHGRFDGELLRWIDRSASGEETWSTDFDDPRANKALEAFRTSYGRQTALRAPARSVEESAELLATLRGLGYAGPDAGDGEDGLVLPLPGR